MDADQLIARIDATRALFERSTGSLTEEHSGFRPVEGTFTAAQQVAHTAQTVDWFRDGALGDGFDVDFERHIEETVAVTSLTAARDHLAAAFDRLRSAIAAAGSEALAKTVAADSPIFPGAPRWSALLGVEEHTAHHRGALTVYARLLGLTPPMPYAP